MGRVPYSSQGKLQSVDSPDSPNPVQRTFTTYENQPKEDHGATSGNEHITSPKFRDDNADAVARF